jgi:hypothetical protein
MRKIAHISNIMFSVGLLRESLVGGSLADSVLARRYML